MPNSLHTYILNIYDLVLVWFYGISTIVGYLMPEPLYKHILNRYILVWFGLVLWHINHCILFNSKSSLYKYIEYIWLGLVWFYDIWTIVGYLIPNPLHTYISYLPTPSCLTKAEEPSLSYYLPIAGRRIIGFIPFPMVLVLCEMQSVLSRIWTRVAVFISYDDNNYATGTFIHIY